MNVNGFVFVAVFAALASRGSLAGYPDAANAPTKVEPSPDLPAPSFSGYGLPISTPLTTDAAGKAAPSVAPAVVRVECANPPSAGTGFVHRSGFIVTAAHVVGPCNAGDVRLIGADAKPFGALRVEVDASRDLALIKADKNLKSSLRVAGSVAELRYGELVTTWGFPGGYLGLGPLLSVGYIAGLAPAPAPDGKLRPRVHVNAAFNSGNSGGPLVRVEDGVVVGVVVSKMAPMPPDVESALSALQSNDSGVFNYEQRLPDGTTKRLTEGPVVAAVLRHLRQQTQLVIGMAVTPDDLRAFLLERKVDP